MPAPDLGWLCLPLEYACPCLSGVVGWLRVREIPLDFGGEGGLKLSFCCGACLFVEFNVEEGGPVCVRQALVGEGRR